MGKLRFKGAKDYAILLSLFDNYYKHIPNKPVHVRLYMKTSIRALERKIRRYADKGFNSMTISSSEIDTLKFIDRNLDYTAMSEEQKDFAITFTIL